MVKRSSIVEAARKHALNEETVRKQVDRLGTTEYELSELGAGM